MNLQEKYNWAILYAAQFGVGFILAGLSVILGEMHRWTDSVIAMAVAYATIGIVHAFRIVYLKGKNSA